jgi:hypothetical protein
VLIGDPGVGTVRLTEVFPWAENENVSVTGDVEAAFASQTSLMLNPIEQLYIAGLHRKLGVKPDADKRYAHRPVSVCASTGSGPGPCKLATDA